MNKTFPIEIEKIYISDGHDFKGRFGQEPLRHETPSVDVAECVAGRGVKGDRYFGHRDNYKGQITLIDRATIDAVAARLGEESLDPGVFRRNVVVKGMDLNELIGKRFKVGSAWLVGTEECAPCFWMDEVIGDGAMQTMQGRGGLRCRILESGTINLGPCELEIGAGEG
jgi:MOSC domain-containing protein YiiM